MNGLYHGMFDLYTEGDNLTKLTGLLNLYVAVSAAQNSPLLVLDTVTL